MSGLVGDPDRPGVGDKVVDGRYQALPDAASDRLFTLFSSLVAEVWTVRDRLRLVEAALTAHGIGVGDLIDERRNFGDELDTMRVDRDAFVERVFSSLVPLRSQ